MSLTVALENIGLSSYESEVYLALLKLGRSNAGPIIRTTKFHRQHVYTALERLQERSLVTYLVKNGRRQFSAISPDDLLRRETERFRSFASVVPDLKAVQKKAANQLHVETLIGPNELMQALLSATDSAAKGDGLLRIIGGERGSELYNFMGARYSEYVRYVKAKGVSKRLITSPSAIDAYRNRLLEEPRAQLRLHDLGYSTPTFSLMTHELIDLGIVSDEIIILRIWSKTLAKTHIEQFNLLWKLGKPVKKRKG